MCKTREEFQESLVTTTAAARPRPPFRADHVGSLLRPPELLAARLRLLGPQTPTSSLGPHDNAELRAVEDRCVRDVVAMQKRVGLRSATDGEFRRRSWWLETILSWEGFAADRTGALDFRWRNDAGKTDAFSKLAITGKVRWRESAVARAAAFLRGATDAVAKVTIPAPTMVHLFAGGDNAIRRSPAYNDADAFRADLVAAYRREIAAIIAAGARYIQLDDTAIAFLCDPAHRVTMGAWGKSPEALLVDYAKLINETLAEVPDDVTVTLHQCRGNREGQWAAEGGYDPVADVMFNSIDVDGFFLEYDSARAGGFEPLRLLPKGRIVVLGLVSSKTAALESADVLRARVDAAAKFVALDQLAISPQCGFASSIGGNPLTQADQEAKLARLVEVAGKIWADA